MSTKVPTPIYIGPPFSSLLLPGTHSRETTTRMKAPRRGKNVRKRHRELAAHRTRSNAVAFRYKSLAVCPSEIGACGSHAITIRDLAESQDSSEGVTVP